MVVSKDTLLGFGIKNNLFQWKQISGKDILGLFLDEKWNLWKLIMKKSFRPPGFATGVENLGGPPIYGCSSKFEEGGLRQYMGEHGEGGFKCCQKIPVKEFI